ncbi:hypothetical protein BH10PSE19_BH10PSE19_13980 [soil metagenome]
MQLAHTDLDTENFNNILSTFSTFPKKNTLNISQNPNPPPIEPPPPIQPPPPPLDPNIPIP